MYVTGLGQARRQPGFVRPRPRMFLVPRLRGMGASGSTEASCTSPNYWDSGSGICCAPIGTPPEADPCSILNSQGFLQAQATDVGPINPATGVPISAGTGPGAAELAEVAGYPNNVQTDAMNCWNNPGLTFVDAMGITINCPAPALDDNGIYVSAYSAGQLAAMLAPTATPAVSLPGNAPFAQPANTGPAPTPQATNYPLSVRLVNTSGGSNSSFNVGDSWQIVVSGTPNAPVTASATQNGTSLGTSSMGTIGSNGQLVITGTMTAAQAGNWTESWSVGGQNAGSVSFSVAAAGSSASSAGSSNTSTANPMGSGTSTGGGSSTTDLSSLLSGSFTVAGVSIPYWAAGAAALGLFFLMGRK